MIEKKNTAARQKFVLAMSGGVDSSAAALLLRDAGDCLGVTLTMFPGADPSSAIDARRVCDTLGLPHATWDASAAFRRYVTDYFADAYAGGRTPNPCVVCNRHVKFGFLLDCAIEDGYDTVATGHYARIWKDGGRVLVRKAADARKDQSYVLAMLTAEQLRHVAFPLGELSKAEIRAMAEEAGLITAHKSDSQDICFIPDGDYDAFLTRYTGEAAIPGDFLAADGTKLGTHRGQRRYTIGQSRGLGIALGCRMYVTAKDAAANTVTIDADEGSLYRTRVTCRSWNNQTGERLPDGMVCAAKLRYAHHESPCRVWESENGGLVLEFATPQRAPTPGQFAVLYDGDIVLGGGEIV